MIRRLFGGVAAGLTCTACGLLGPVDVEVRLENASAVSFELATLYTADGPVTHVDLPAGAATPWSRVSRAYDVATTEVVVDTDTVRLQVIDHVGEDPLSGGCYTYVIGLEPPTGRPIALTQRLRDGC